MYNSKLENCKLSANFKYGQSEEKKMQLSQNNVYFMCVQILRNSACFLREPVYRKLFLFIEHSWG